MNDQIFREYDIRGIIGKDLTPDVVKTLGRAFGTYFRTHSAVRISLGRDGRLSSPEIRDQLLEGLVSTGMHVIDLGVIPTPLSYYSTHRLDIEGAVMITGSHNPPEYNGFKVSLGKEAIYGSEIQAIREIIKNGSFNDDTGSSEEYDIKPEYIDDLSVLLKLSRPVRLAVDPGNGVGSLTAGPLLERLGCDVLMLNGEVDGSFPNHHPDPTIESNLAQLKKAVKDNDLELGIAYDGDADRIGVIDEKGNVLWGDQILAILAREVLEAVPNALIIGEVKCSKLLFDDIERHGGRQLMWKVGHSLIKDKMLKSGAQLAGEMSGHIFFRHRYYGFDDAVYVSARLLEIVAKADKPLSRFLENWQKMYNTPEIRVECPDEIKFQLVDRVKQWFSSRYEVIDVDGMRVILPGGWGLLRASNTQPVVVLRYEANTEKRLEEIKREVESVLRNEREKL